MNDLQKTYEEYKYKSVNLGFNGLGDFVYLRTYSRLKDDNTKETWQDTLYRVVSNLFTFITEDQMKEIQQTPSQMYKYFVDVKCLPSGRSLWAMDRKVIDKCGGVCLNSCSFFSFNEGEPLEEIFCLLMNTLMLGCGCSFDTFIENNENYIYWPIEEYQTLLIPDTREGWVFSMKLLLKSYFYKDMPRIKFLYDNIRPKGQILKTFGGYSSGAEPLKTAHKAIRKLLIRNIGHKINSKIITDICCIIARMVVSGNVRRSAMLALGHIDDTDFLDLKDYDKNEDRIEYGYCTNNSIAIEKELDDYTNIIQRIKKNGEPALIFMDNIRRYSRMGHRADNKDFYKVIGLNPCGEISLRSHEFCNLSEVFLNRIDSKDEFIDVLKYAFMFCKIVSTIKTGIKKSDDIIKQNRRIGVSLSGIIQFIDKHNIDTLIDWLKAGYDVLRDYDTELSKILGTNESIKITTCKPSGTLSLLAGAIPSITRPYYRKYIRRVRLSKDDPLVGVYKKLGYEIEDDVVCKENKIIKFIVDIGDIKLNSGNIEDDLELASILQKYWCDNNVSMTVQFDPNINDSEFNDIIKNYSKQLKTMCFLPRDCTYYPQKPYEELSDEQYETEINNIIKRRKLNQSRYNWFNIDDENVSTELHEKELNIYCDSLACLDI